MLSSGGLETAAVLIADIRQLLCKRVVTLVLVVPHGSCALAVPTGAAASKVVV
jgi:hypothetical protein